jgi:hypothetical protein
MNAVIFGLHSAFIYEITKNPKQDGNQSVKDLAKLKVNPNRNGDQRLLTQMECLRSLTIV